MVLGIATGVLFGTAASDRIGWIGELFMRLLRMIIVPLVLTSIITGVASVGGGRAIGRMFSRPARAAHALDTQLPQSAHP